MLRRRKLGKSGFPKVYGLLPEHSSEDSPPPGVTAPRSRFALLGSLVLASHPPTAGSPRDFAQVTCPLWALPRGDPGRLSLRRCPRIQGLGGRAQRVVVGEGRGEVAVPARPTPLPPRRHPFPRVFSACSRRQLRAFFRKGGGACLSNAPDSRLLVPRARCGNGLVEEGEECDCGASQVGSGPEVGAPPAPSPSPSPRGVGRGVLTWSHNPFSAPGMPGRLLPRAQLLAARGGPVQPRGLLRALPGEGVGGWGEVRGRSRAGLSALAEGRARGPGRVRALLRPGGVGLPPGPPASEPRYRGGSLPVHCLCASATLPPPGHLHS